jgi:hypothetical protein
MLLSAPGVAVFIFLMAAVAGFWIALGQGSMVLNLGAFAFGYLFREFQLIRRSARLWPIVGEVLDWEKVDAVLSGNADTAHFQKT